METSTFPDAVRGKRTGIVKDMRYLNHCMGDDHPECPERLQAIYSMLEAPDMAGRFTEISPLSATEDLLHPVHTPRYVKKLKATEGNAFTYLDADTSTCARSHESALLAAGGLCRAIALVHSKELDNAFALIRPPGHHAEKCRAKGFCLYNNIAVGARFAQSHLRLNRVLIVDWDLHHGNGTEHCFDHDPSVLYFSVHQRRTFPGTGRFGNVGKSQGKGFTVNVPFSPGCGDAEYLLLFETILKTIAGVFAPDMVLVSAGFDIHFADPLGAMSVTPTGFAGLTRSVMDIAATCCEGKIVMTLEGGYETAALRDSVKAVLLELAGLSVTNTAEILAAADKKKLQPVFRKILSVHQRYWPSLASALEPYAMERDPHRKERMKNLVEKTILYLKG